MSKKVRRSSRKTLAAQADKYQLYISSVQAPDVDVDFFDRAFRSFYGRKPSVLREDFCGTAVVCYEWVRSGRDRTAIGVDLDPEPLAWGIEHVATKLSDAQRRRVTLVQDDVRKVQGAKADVVAAQNFSYLVFKTRDELRAYFRAAYRNLKRKGLLVLDLMGGPEVLEEDHQEETYYRPVYYVWDQARFDPITYHCRFHIHFRFKDGSTKRRAFTYDWRLWTIPEVRELLAEAGFRETAVYWEDADSETGEGTGAYRQRASAPSDTAWICYIVGAK